MNGISDKIYAAWRRSEAYAVPMTPEGEKAAVERLKRFAVGFKYGVRAAAFLLENMHRENKKTHSFFLQASRKVLDLLKEDK